MESSQWDIWNYLFYRKVSFFYRPSLSISKCKSGYEADIAVSVVFFISSSMGQMRSTKLPNLELFSEEEFEDAKGEIRIRTSKDREHTDQKKKEK